MTRGVGCPHFVDTKLVLGPHTSRKWGTIQKCSQFFSLQNGGTHPPHSWCTFGILRTQGLYIMGNLASTYIWSYLCIPLHSVSIWFCQILFISIWFYLKFPDFFLLRFFPFAFICLMKCVKMLVHCKIIIVVAARNHEKSERGASNSISIQNNPKHPLTYFPYKMGNLPNPHALHILMSTNPKNTTTWETCSLKPSLDTLKMPPLQNGEPVLHIQIGTLCCTKKNGFDGPLGVPILQTKSFGGWF